jgi:predicted CoA-binding protein
VAIVGASRRREKTGSALVRELTAKGYEVHPVHPEAAELEGRACVPSVDALPAGVAGLIVVLPAATAASMLAGMPKSGVKRVWLLKGATSKASIDAAKEKGLDLVQGLCPLMFYPPVDGVHSFHRLVKRLFGTMPA